MKRSPRTLVGLLVLISIGTFAGCGGGSGDSGTESGAPVVVEPTTNVTVKQFQDAFADETGFELTADSFPGGAQLLSFDDDGDPMEFSDAETGFANEFGSAQIYVVEADGDPEMILDVVVGEAGKGDSVEFGGELVRIDRRVSKPDADEVIWSEQCVVYEGKKTPKACSWSGTKRYGQNVIVTWTSPSSELSPSAARLDRAVSATVAGS
jgi:hypothetical protein